MDRWGKNQERKRLKRQRIVEHKLKRRRQRASELEVRRKREQKQREELEKQARGLSELIKPQMIETRVEPSVFDCSQWAVKQTKQEQNSISFDKTAWQRIEANELGERQHPT